MESTLRARLFSTIEHQAMQAHGLIGLSQQQVQAFVRLHIAAQDMEQVIAIQVAVLLM